MNLKQYFGTLNNQNKKLLNYKVVDLIESYYVDIKFIFIQIYIEKLWIIFGDTILRDG